LQLLGPVDTYLRRADALAAHPYEIGLTFAPRFAVEVVG
jgi:hypothetical protein